MNSPRSENKGRVVFIDQARTLAIALMLVGHSLDCFLGEPWRSGTAYQRYQFVRGLSSALFLTVAGFSFVVASFKYFSSYQSFSPRLKARIQRIGLILLLGYILHLFAPTLSQSIANFDAAKWEQFVRFDVLQNIGIGLILLHLVLWFSRTAKGFFIAAITLMVAAFLLALITYRPEIDARVPIEISQAINLYHGSRFPLIPYVGYMLLGSIMGCLFRWLYGSPHERLLFAVIVAVALMLIAFEVVFRNFVPGGIFPYSTPAARMPGNTFARAACAMLVISGLYFLGLKIHLLPRLSFILSKESLAIYFIHLEFVYGRAPLNPFAQYRHGMSPLQITAWILSLAALMFSMALAISFMRRRHPQFLVILRRGLIIGGIGMFVLAESLSPEGAVIYAVLGILGYGVIVNPKPFTLLKRRQAAP